MSDKHYELVIAPTARRQLTDHLPEPVAFAVYEFIIGPLLENPHRVGKRLRSPLNDRNSACRGTYRVIYRIDDTRRLVTVVGVVAHADAYRPTDPFIASGSPCATWLPRRSQEFRAGSRF